MDRGRLKSHRSSSAMMGKSLLQTIGTPGQSGADGTHFNRPTFLTWLPDSTMFVSDGYNGTRVAKFDKNGKFLLDWGRKAIPPNETRPGYFNVVHGLAVDPVRITRTWSTANHRMQVFDENGKFLDQWPSDQPSSVNFLYLAANRKLWAADDTIQDREVRLMDCCSTRGARWRLAGRAVQYAWDERRPGRKPVHRRSGQWARAEVCARDGGQSEFSGGEAGVFGVEIGRRHPLGG